MSNDDDLGAAGQFGLGAVTRLAVVGGGAWLAWKVLGTNKKLQECKDLEEETRARLRRQYENPDSLSDGQYQTFIQTDKNIVKTLNQGLPAEERIDVPAVEDDLRGEPLDVQAATWTTYAHQQALACVASEADKDVVQRIVESWPEWLQNYYHVLIAAGGAAVVAAIVARILGLEPPGPGGLLDIMRNYGEMVKRGIVGDPDVAEQAELQYRTHEAVETTPSGGVSGSPRAAAQQSGAPIEDLQVVLSALGIAADVVIDVSAGVVDFILQVTTLTEQQVAQRPELVVYAAVVIAVAAIAAAIDGPAPVGDAVGIAFVALALAAVGVGIDRDGVREVAGDVHDDIVA